MADNPHSISLKDAAALTARWRQNMSPGGFKAARFDRIAFDTLLAQPGCAGIRIYMGMHEEQLEDFSNWTYVMIATDTSGKDIIGQGLQSGADAGDGNPQQLPDGCPPFCDPDSPLNDGVRTLP